MSVGILLTIGKYLFVALLYLFVALVFRALMMQAQAEAQIRRRAIAGPRRPPRRISLLTSQPTQEPEAPPEDLGPAQPVAAEEPEPPPQPSPSVLVVQTSAEAILPPDRCYPLGGTVTIGRGSHNTIVLPDRYVSKEHAVIYLQEGQYLLADQNSTNGTYHNGTRITDALILADGDEITIGTTVFTYQAEETTSFPG